MIEDGSLRRFRPEDLEAVKSLIDNTIKISYSDYPEEFIEYWTQNHSKEHILGDASKGFVIVLEYEGSIIGTGTLLGENIERVFVHPSYQGKGFGSRIMSCLEEHTLAKGTKSLNLTSTLVSKQFYDSLGYITLEEIIFPSGNGKKLGYCIMMKNLEGASKK